MIPRGWKFHQLGDLVDSMSAGVSVNSDDDATGLTDDLRVLKTSSVTSGCFIPEESKRIIDSEISKARISPVANSIIMSRMNTQALVGASAYVAEAHPRCFLPDRLWLLEDSKRQVSMKWLSYVLGSGRMRSRISGMATGTSGSMKNISKESILSLEILTPPKDEQEKIAKILSTWDEAIEKIQKAIDAKVLEKEQIIRMLCLNEERLSKHDSKKTIIGEFCSEFNERNKMDIYKEVLSCTKSRGFVRSLDFFDKQVFSNDLTTYKVIKRGMFGFPSNHIEEGSIGLQNVVDVGLVSPIYTIFQCDKNIIDSDFLFAILKTETYRQKFQSSTNASVDRRGSLRWNAFSKIEINLPPLEYQIRVANLIKVLNNAIELYTNIKVKTLRQKRGLMQQLLTGKKRVKV